MVFVVPFLLSPAQNRTLSVFAINDNDSVAESRKSARAANALKKKEERERERERDNMSKMPSAGLRGFSLESIFQSIECASDFLRLREDTRSHTMMAAQGRHSALIASRIVPQFSIILVSLLVSRHVDMLPARKKWRHPCFHAHRSSKLPSKLPETPLVMMLLLSAQFSCANYRQRRFCL